MTRNNRRRRSINKEVNVNAHDNRGFKLVHWVSEYRMGTLSRTDWINNTTRVQQVENRDESSRANRIEGSNREPGNLGRNFEIDRNDDLVMLGEEGSLEVLLSECRELPSSMSSWGDQRVMEKSGDNPPKDDNENGVIMGSEPIARFQQPSEGITPLTTIHGEDMRNGSEDGGVSQRTSLKDEISQEMVFFQAKPEAKETQCPEDLGKAKDEPSPSPHVDHGEGSKTKESVSKKMMEQLAGAGWAVFYPPTGDDEEIKYDEAVYYSPDGKTYWSITLAYNRLKHHYEAGDGEGLVYEKGFHLTPIPEEDISLLLTEGERNVENNEADQRVMKKQEVVVEKLETARCCGSRRTRRSCRRKELKPIGRKKTVLSWMIQMGTIKENEKVQYVDNKGKCVLYGEVTYDGILCGSCNKDMSISEFEAHSRINASDPLRNIYVEKGNSLLQCMIETWNKQDESAREDFHIFAPREGDHWDDVCAVCGTDDGNLFICCESCTLTFHKSCLDMETIPAGKWHCFNCRCKFCGSHVANQMDGFEGFFMSKLFECRMCGKRYHKSCGEASGGDDFNSEQAFCDKKCKEIFERLQLLLGVQHKLDDNYTWRFIRRAAIGSNALQIEPHVIECNSKLAVAMSIMNDCFKPFADSRSGINMMNSVVYNRGSNFARLNCSRFFTAILESGDEVISVANLRIHEKKVAEMPYVATGPLYMNQGMWRRLMKGIVWALGYLEVETLVIPAVPHLENFWCASFGFERVDENDEKVMKKMNMLVFPHSVVLKKTIPKYTGFYDPDAAVPQHQKSKSRSKSKRVRRAN